MIVSLFEMASSSHTDYANLDTNKDFTSYAAEDGYLSEQFIKRLSGDFDITCTITINARNTDISNLGCIYMCEALVAVDLGSNSISDLTPLYKLKSLQILDLSNNNIKSLKGLESMPELYSLNLSGNHIASFSDLRMLETILQLKKLVLRDGNVGNPICVTEGYQKKIKSLLPDLAMLDYCYLKGELSTTFNRLDELESQVQADDDPYYNLPQAKPLVDPDFWDTPDLFDDLDLKMGYRYLKEAVNAVYVEKYRAEDMMKILADEQEENMRRISRELREPSISRLSTSSNKG